jgi:hypothetical protein
MCLLCLSWFGLVLSRVLLPPYRNPSLFVSFVERDEIINVHQPLNMRHSDICILTPIKCRPSMVQTVTFPPSMASAKVTDVKRDVFDTSQGELNYLTSDQGVKISDTDNW